MSIKGICLVGAVLRFTGYIEEVGSGRLVSWQSSILDLTLSDLVLLSPRFFFFPAPWNIFLLNIQRDLVCRYLWNILSVFVILFFFFLSLFFLIVCHSFAFTPLSSGVMCVFVQQKEPSSDASSPSSPRFAPPSKRTRRQTASEPSSSDTSPSPQTKGQRVSWGIPTYCTRSALGLVFFYTRKFN